jgi:hypothetical protein
MLHTITGMAAFIYEIGALTLFCLAWSQNHHPPNLRFLRSFRWQALSTMPSYWLRGTLTNFLPRLALNWNPLNVSQPPKKLELQAWATSTGLASIFLRCIGLNLGPTPWATQPTLFCDGFFQTRVLRTIYPSQLQTMILMISASWVATSIQWLA